MQVTYEADRALTSHDALGEMDFGVKSISLTARFPEGLQLDRADLGFDGVSGEAFREWLRYAVDSLQDHEYQCAEHQRVEAIVREILGGEGVEMELEVTVELCDET